MKMHTIPIMTTQLSSNRTRRMPRREPTNSSSKKNPTMASLTTPDEDVPGAQLKNRVERLEGDDCSEETRERGLPAPLRPYQLPFLVLGYRRIGSVRHSHSCHATPAFTPSPDNPFHRKAMTPKLLGTWECSHC